MDWNVLLKWYRALESSRRNNPQSVLDLNPQGLVTWTEVLIKMRELGYTGNAVDARIDFEERK